MFWRFLTGTVPILRFRIFGDQSVPITQNVTLALNAAQYVLPCIVSHEFLHREPRDPDHADLSAAPAVFPTLSVKSVSLFETG